MNPAHDQPPLSTEKAERTATEAPHKGSESLVERLRSTYRGHNVTHLKAIEDVSAWISTSLERCGREDTASVDESAMQGTIALHPEGPHFAEQEEPLRWLLKTLVACGGQTDASDTKWNPLNVFCDDFEPIDTFNLAIDQGFTRSTYDSDFDTATVYLTDAGRAWVDSSNSATRRPADGGDSEAQHPAEWLRVGNLLYTLTQDGWRKGDPIMVNRLMVTVQWNPKFATDEEGEALIEQLLAAISSEEQPVSPSEASAGNSGLDTISILEARQRELEEALGAARSVLDRRMSPNVCAIIDALLPNPTHGGGNA